MTRRRKRYAARGLFFIIKSTFFNRKSGLLNRKSGFFNSKSVFFHLKLTGQGVLRGVVQPRRRQVEAVLRSLRLPVPGKISGRFIFSVEILHYLCISNLNKFLLQFYCSYRPKLKPLIHATPFAAKFIIFNTQFLVLDAQFSVLNTKFIIFTDSSLSSQGTCKIHHIKYKIPRF